MKILQQNFRQLFMDIPDSEEDMFEKIQKYMSMADPAWLQTCKPASKLDIWRLEKTLVERFGRGIPSSYRIYLELMGKDDGGLVSLRVDDPEFWNYFKGDNMARGAAYFMKHIDEQIVRYGGVFPPFWNFYYTMHAGCGWGFAPKVKCPDRIIESSGIDKYYLTHDTFLEFVFYCTYDAIIDRILDYGTAFTHSVNELPDKYQNMHSVWFYAVCPIEWDTSGYTPLVNFLQEVEHTCSIDECWFSSQKEFNLFDIYDNIHIGRYEFARYVGCHSTANLTVSVCFETSPGDRPEIQVRIISQDVRCTKQLVDEILKRTTLIEKSLTIRCID